MGRVAAKILCAAAALSLIAAVPAASGDRSGSSGNRRSPGEGKNAVRRLDEVKIVGSAEHPGILFFLPRARFRLLPLPADRDWKDEILRDDRDKGEMP